MPLRTLLRMRGAHPPAVDQAWLVAPTPDLGIPMIPGIFILAAIVLALWEGYNEFKARQS